MKPHLCLLLALAPPAAFAQWTDIQKLGTGGEAFVSTDGKGMVYATSHQPCKLYVSKDFGKTFDISHDLPESMCDVCSTVGPDGKLYVIYIRPNVSGMQVMFSSDKGKTLERGATHPGPFDREWIVVDPITNVVGFNYSNGYIGGPKSKGIFYAASTDGGKTFTEISRIDKEPAGSYPVDPYLTIGSGGRIYAAWADSKDYDKIDRYMCATSDDGGKTWSNHTEMGTTHPGFGDTQERWMLGSIVATGKDTAMMLYQDYLNVSIDGKEVRPLLAFYRVTTDGGRTWSSARPCLTPKEIDEALHSFVKGNGTSAPVANYAQTLPWICADPKGHIHLAFVDNRDGAKALGSKQVGQWQVRTSTWADGKFGMSERVSHTWTASRPPLDFVGCCADATNSWVIWTENPDKVEGWDFSGDLFIARKPIAP